MGVFANRQRWFLIPLVLVLIAAAALLVATSAIPGFAPFVYAIF